MGNIFLFFASFGVCLNAAAVSRFREDGNVILVAATAQDSKWKNSHHHPQNWGGWSYGPGLHDSPGLNAPAEDPHGWGWGPPGHRWSWPSDDGGRLSLMTSVSSARHSTSTSTLASTENKLSATGTISHPTQSAEISTFGPSPTAQPLAIEQLEGWYHDSASDCGSPDSPSLVCSGVMIRGVDTNLAYFSWDPSPRAVALGSISFSWLRHDQNFAGIIYDNGFILYPRTMTLTGKNKTNEILCSFPVDGYSHTRIDAGCGPLKHSPNTTDTCQNLGVTTPREWLERYENVRYDVCGWNLRGRASDPARSFETCLQTHQELPVNPIGWNLYNELVLKIWPTGSGASLTIHSFYHIGDTLVSLVKAQSDQTRYFDQYQEKIPVVRITLPTTKHGQTAFSYSEDEQLAGKPNLQYDLTFENVTIGPKDKFMVDGIRFELNGDKSGVSDEPLNPQGPIGLDTGMTATNVTGRYVTTDYEMYVEIPGSGLRTVTFDWGCRTFCFLSEVVSRNDTTLYDDDAGIGGMQYGQAHFQVTAPEVFWIMTAQTGSLDFVLDNLSIS